MSFWDQVNVLDYIDPEKISRIKSPKKLEKIKLAIEATKYDRKYRKIKYYFDKDGYEQHKKFFAAGRWARERCFSAGNRVGKTISGAFEIACHAMGLYPDWWEGRRFDRPVRIWVAGKTLETTRDIIQKTLLGWGEEGRTDDNLGTGLIPRSRIINTTPKAGGVPNCVDAATIRHCRGKSVIGFKAYKQGRGSFEGTAQDVVWLDEEPPNDIYNECLIRTGTTNGLILLTFTPLEGYTDTVMSFLPAAGEVESAAEDGIVRLSDSKCLVMAGWDDAPHLDEKTKKELLESTPPHLRDARSKGIPSLGSGSIYPIPEDDIKVDPIYPLPDHWRRMFALDPGWNRTAALWAAWDIESDIIYLYAEHYQGQAEAYVHARAIKSRGDWIPGCIDPASRGRSQTDGKKLISQYRDEGLNIVPAANQVESGINDVWQRLSTGKIKVFSHLNNFFSEYRLYRRDENGKIVKSNDHLMDCMRYIVLNLHKCAKTKTQVEYERAREMMARGGAQGTGQQVSTVGY